MPPLASFSSFLQSILQKPRLGSNSSIRNPYLERYSQRNMVMDLHKKKFTLLQGYKYVQPRDVARMILKHQQICHKTSLSSPSPTGNYLDCIVQWGEIKQLTRRFSLAIRNNDTLEDPSIFLDWYRNQFRI